MKKYKIGKRIITADSIVEAVKIVKMLDSPKTRVVSRDSWTEVYEKFIEISNKYLPNVSRINSEITKLYSSHIGEADWEEAYRRWRGTKSRDSESSEIDELTQEEQQAVEDYREAIKNTSNPKLLKIYSHILEEETEHLQELARAKEVDDACGKMKDDRLSPMTYKKLKELGVRPEQWKKWTQEQANEFIRNKGQKGSEKKEENANKSKGKSAASESLSTLLKTSNFRKLASDIDNFDDLSDEEQYKLDSKLDDAVYDGLLEANILKGSERWRKDGFKISTTESVKNKLVKKLGLPESMFKKGFESSSFDLREVVKFLASNDNTSDEEREQHARRTVNSSRRAEAISKKVKSLTPYTARHLLTRLANAKLSSKSDVEEYLDKNGYNVSKDESDAIYSIYSAEEY